MILLELNMPTPIGIGKILDDNCSPLIKFCLLLCLAYQIRMYWVGQTASYVTDIPEFLNSGRKNWTLDSEPWTLGGGLWTLNVRLWTLKL